tara:strand:- start:2358 stop:3263 length:906 start_codon:yes stop_codon:yes gene_type:complete
MQFYTVSLLFKKIRDMKKMMKIAAMLLVVVTTTNAVAQEMPQPSPAAKVEQRIGLTDVTVEYSRPSVKGREIWGALEAYDVVWRAGANANTLITFSDDVSIEGEELKAGTYSFFITPAKGAWKVMFNTVVDGWGTGNYDVKNDALTLKVKPTNTELQESLSYRIENLTKNTGTLVFSWGKVALRMVIEVKVEVKAWKNIETALAEATEKTKSKVLRNGAKYTVTTGSRLNEGLVWINESIQTEEFWYSYWVKADVQHAMGDNKGAVASINKAIELGETGAQESGKPFGYKEKLEKAIAEYK